MTSSREPEGRRWAAGHLAQKEAQRRALQVGKVGFIVVVTILATLVFSGHRLSPECVRAWVCIEGGFAE